MSKLEKTKAAAQILLDLVLVVFAIPVTFVFAYFFPLFFSGSNELTLAKSLGNLSLHLSWVSAPVIVTAVLVLKLMIRRERKWLSILLTSYAAGVIWLLLWNLVVENLFTFWRSVIPLSLCCLFSMAYMMGKTLYKSDKMNFTDEPDVF